MRIIPPGAIGDDRKPPHHNDLLRFAQRDANPFSGRRGRRTYRPETSPSSHETVRWLITPATGREPKVCSTAARHPDLETIVTGQGGCALSSFVLGPKRAKGTGCASAPDFTRWHGHSGGNVAPVSLPSERLAGIAANQSKRSANVKYCEPIFCVEDSRPRGRTDGAFGLRESASFRHFSLSIPGAGAGFVVGQAFHAPFRHGLVYNGQVKTPTKRPGRSDSWQHSSL